jgi:hypothetical protein
MSTTAGKSFVSSVIAGPVEDAPEVTYPVDGRDVTFMTPDINQIILSTSLIESATSDIKAGAALINIFFGLVKPDETFVDLAGEEVDDDSDLPEHYRFNDYTLRWLQAKMMDHRDPFGVEVIAEIMRSLIEEWSANPTRGSSSSSSSRKPAGTASKATPRGRASTRGVSR